MRDETTNASNAEPIMTMAMSPTEGFLCPRTDQDWYSFDVPAGSRLVDVTLATTVMRSPTQPVYSIFTRMPSGEAGPPVAMASAAVAGMPLQGVHCVDPGSYVLSVRDERDDAQDPRNPYRLTVTTRAEPDTNEPNNDTATAQMVTPGTAITGSIACVGDEDWFAVDVPAGTVLSVHLTQEIAQMQPTIRILDAMSMHIISQSNLGGAVRPTDIATCRLVPGGLRYYVVVSDDDDEDADADVPYMLTVDTIVDTDAHEPNNDMAQATSLPAMSCGGAWTSVPNQTGSIACAGDTDWYAIPVTGCTGGVIEATMTFDTSALSAEEQWEFQTSVQASIELVRTEAGSPCTNDSECATLTRTCDTGDDGPWDCAGALNTCLEQGSGGGLCAGASICAPNSQCAAVETQRLYRMRDVPVPVSGTPPSNTITLSAPIMGNPPVVFLRVIDYQSNGGDARVPYTLTVRLRRDPDPTDATATPNNIYTNSLPETMDDIGIDQNQPVAAPIPIHDCTAGDCCGPGNWVVSPISYENDFDWYTYPHPCPGADCMVRIVFQTDAGPVEPELNLYTGTDLWFDAPLPSGTSGAFGGLGASDRCLYAYQLHSRPYYVAIRDLADDGHNWSSDQLIRFCVEKVANACVSPCFDYGPAMPPVTVRPGCDQPP